jgi:DNA-binding protein WhiA
MRVLEAEGMLDDQPPALREAAELRLRYPEASLRELAAKARPPASKAALHRRLRKLSRLAEEVADSAFYGLQLR